MYACSISMPVTCIRTHYSSSIVCTCCWQTYAPHIHKREMNLREFQFIFKLPFNIGILLQGLELWRPLVILHLTLQLFECLQNKVLKRPLAVDVLAWMAWNPNLLMHKCTNIQVWNNGNEQKKKKKRRKAGGVGRRIAQNAWKFLGLRYDCFKNTWFADWGSITGRAL